MIRIDNAMIDVVLSMIGVAVSIIAVLVSMIDIRCAMIWFVMTMFGADYAIAYVDGDPADLGSFALLPMAPTAGTE